MLERALLLMKIKPKVLQTFSECPHMLYLEYAMNVIFLNEADYTKAKDACDIFRISISVSGFIFCSTDY